MKNFAEMSRGERIYHRRTSLKLSPAYVGKCVGVTRVSVLNWEEDDVNDIAWPKFEKLAEVLLTTPDWLEHGRAAESYISNSADGEIIKCLSGTHVLKSESIPIKAISENGIDDNSSTGEYVDMPAKSGGIFAIKLEFDNGLCRAYAGDAIILDEGAESVPGEEVCIEFSNGKSGIYVFNYLRDGQINCSDEKGKVIFNETDVKRMIPIVAVARNSYVKKRS